MNEPRCETCKNIIPGEWRKSSRAKKKPLRFCSESCANTRKPTKEQKEKAAAALKKFYGKINESQKQEIIERIGKTINKNHKEPKSILDFSSRTTQKILRRIMNQYSIGCSICNWDKEVCDLHHIIPTYKGGDNKDSNLTYVCPNCHRMIHSGKIDIALIINLKTYFINKKIDWTKYFYH
jgi:uncharacterized metal-binding protein